MIWDKHFHFRTAYLPFSFDVAECVISREEHEYYGDTMCSGETDGGARG